MRDLRFPRIHELARSGGLHGISSPGMLDRTESACLGDASKGVARNPLETARNRRACSRATEQDVRPAESTKSFAALHRASGQRRSTWVAACAALIPAVPPENDGHELRHSSRPCSSHFKDVDSTAIVSSRGGLNAASPRSPSPPQGLCRPACEPGRLPSNQGEEYAAHMVLCAREVSPTSLLPLHVTSMGEPRRKTATRLFEAQIRLMTPRTRERS